MTIKNFFKLIAVLGLFLGIFSIGGTAKASSEISVRISEPESPATTLFNVNFVALDLEDRPLTAVCYVKKPGETNFVPFGSAIKFAAGGNTENCPVDGHVLDMNGMYTFKVLVAPQSGGNLVESKEVTVDFNGDVPHKPDYIEKNKKSSCKNEITLRTANDGITAYVEVYRSQKLDFTAEPDMIVKTKTIGSDEKYTFTDDFYGADCGKTYYYAVRAFSKYGVGSNVRAEEVTTTTHTTKTEETKVTQEAIPTKTGAALGTGGPTGGPEPEVVAKESTSSNQSVLGEKAAEEPKTLGEQISSTAYNLSKNPLFWLAVMAASLGFGYFAYIKRFRA